MTDLVERLRHRANDKRPMPKPYNLLLDAAEHIEQLESGIRRLSDEEELLSETTGEVATMVSLAAKLATAESTLSRLERELAEARRLGGQMSNVLYNLAQTADLSVANREAMKELTSQWDAAIRQRPEGKP